MQIQVEDNTATQLQKYTTLTFTKSDKEFFSQWLMEIGLKAVESALSQNPGLTLGQLLSLSYKAK